MSHERTNTFSRRQIPERDVTSVAPARQKLAAVSERDALEGKHQSPAWDGQRCDTLKSIRVIESHQTITSSNDRAANQFHQLRGKRRKRDTRHRLAEQLVAEHETRRPRLHSIFARPKTTCDCRAPAFTCTSTYRETAFSALARYSSAGFAYEPPFPRRRGCSPV
jgi:hypothetical protein